MIKTLIDAEINGLVAEGADGIPSEIVNTLGEAGIYSIVSSRKGLTESQQR